MEQGPRQRIIRKVMLECLSRIRLHDNLDENKFSKKITDFPTLLREWADLLGNPPKDLRRFELPEFKGYSLWAENYDNEKNNPVIIGEEEVIWDLIGNVKSLRVLDAGCGTGRHTIPMAKQGADIIAYDPTLEMLLKAKQKAKKHKLNIDFRLGTLKDIDSNTGKFDLVLCCLVLSHVKNLHKAVKKLAGYIKKDGSLIISDFHPFNLLIGFRTAFSSKEKRYVVPNYLHLPSDYYNVIQDAGLEVTHYYEKGHIDRYPDFPMTIILKAKAI